MKKIVPLVLYRYSEKKPKDCCYCLVWNKAGTVSIEELYDDKFYNCGDDYVYWWAYIPDINEFECVEEKGKKCKK